MWTPITTSVYNASGENCGTGAGGFKRGNSCGSGEKGLNTPNEREKEYWSNKLVRGTRDLENSLVDEFNELREQWNTPTSSRGYFDKIEENLNKIYEGYPALRKARTIGERQKLHQQLGRIHSNIVHTLTVEMDSTPDVEAYHRFVKRNREYAKLHRDTYRALSEK